MPVDDKRWFALYTKPRWEKKVYTRLVEQGLETYCPLNKVKKKWSDRVKWVEEPLFKSYVFVRAGTEELTAVRMINGVVNFVYWLGKPAIVKDTEIEIIRKFLNEYRDVVVTPVSLGKNAKITIRRGVFMDKQATVVKVVHNKVQVIIESIGFSLVALIDKSNLAVIEK